MRKKNLGRYPPGRAFWTPWLTWDGTISLFCYPSFCPNMLHSQGVVYAFASSS